MLVAQLSELVAQITRSRGHQATLPRARLSFAEQGLQRLERTGTRPYPASSVCAVFVHADACTIVHLCMGACPSCFGALPSGWSHAIERVGLRSSRLPIRSASAA